MDYLLFFSVISSVLLLLIVIITALKSLRSNIWRKGKLPPGPWKLPIIGSIHHLVGFHSQLVHCRIRELSEKYDELIHLQVGEISTIVVSSPEMAKEVFKTNDINFGKRFHRPSLHILFYDSSGLAFSPLGHYWKLLKKIVYGDDFKNCIILLHAKCPNSLFSMLFHQLNAKHVRSFQSLREKEVSNLIKSLSTQVGCCVNLSEMVLHTICGNALKSIFGEKHNGQEAILSLVHLFMKSTEETLVSDIFPSQKWLQVITGERLRLKKVHDKIDMLLDNIISDFGATHQEDEGECLFSALLNLKNHGDLTIKNLKAITLICPKRQTLHWSGTWPNEVKQLGRRLLHIPKQSNVSAQISEKDSLGQVLRKEQPGRVREVSRLKLELQAANQRTNDLEKEMKCATQRSEERDKQVMGALNYIFKNLPGSVPSEFADLINSQRKKSIKLFFKAWTSSTRLMKGSSYRKLPPPCRTPTPSSSEGAVPKIWAFDVPSIGPNPNHCGLFCRNGKRGIEDT
ncbi:premnaspirodiene oxygenase-like [Senna tora]|uniref:Premnaspirodiene oxygenase-like n=1 Tax=Senna tora TaxID=362788 RepID=A0A834T762_9FABA|nr:premnaspirodiene oxygenase-like [Senna tora]